MPSLLEKSRVLQQLRPRVIIPPVEWIERQPGLAGDATSAAGRFTLDAWQRVVIEDQYRPDVRMVVVIAPEQIGKSTCWRLPMAHKMRFYPAPRWVVYESDEKAEQINRRTLHPVLMGNAEIRNMMPGSYATKGTYELSNGSITDFSGAGADITSKPVCDGVGDEVDRWGTVKFVMQQVRNFAKRFRTFWAKGRGCLTLVSSPKSNSDDPTKARGKGEQSPIWVVFTEQTNRSFWTLRCAGCGHCTMRSCDTRNLQWELKDDAVVEESLRLICPKCGHQHTESEAQTITDAGRFVAKHPEITDRMGRQVGCLAVPRVFRWKQIAEAQLRSGSTATLEEQADFDNSWRGLPFIPTARNKPTEDALRKHAADLPDPEQIANLFFCCDTQDNGFWWAVLAVLPALNNKTSLHVVASGFVETVDFDALRKVWDGEYCGAQCCMGIIDEGGHHGREVQEFVREVDGLYSYKGNSRIGVNYKADRDNSCRILAMPHRYQAELLYYLHTQTNREANYLFLPPDPQPELIKHLASYQPMKDKRNGHHYENWEPGDRPDHLFDSVKMGLVLLDYAKDSGITWHCPVPWQTDQPRPKPKAPTMEDI